MFVTATQTLNADNPKRRNRHVPREGHLTSTDPEVSESRNRTLHHYRCVSQTRPGVIESRVHPVLSLKLGSILPWVYWKHALKNKTFKLTLVISVV